MKTRGFTLVELLGVLLLLAIIALIAFPPIINQIRGTKDQISSATLTLLYNSADLYVDSSPDFYTKTNGDTYCISLQSLVDEGYLVSPIKDANGDKISLSKVIEYRIDEAGTVSHELKKAKNCLESIANPKN